MTGIYIEKRTPSAGRITPDLAKHLYIRFQCGKVAIVAERPVAFLSALRKQWIKMECQVRHERASTLNAARIHELSRQLYRMEELAFTAKLRPGEDQVGVQIGAIAQFLEWAPQCKTMYVTCPITSEELHLIAAWMPKNGLLVVYTGPEVVE